ncbi:XRE family transcriptional regulator [Flavobacterium sp. LS1R10]|jgi:ribosome-binding protein aMBF1 (putative translation factor)|nr:XRE family transcriptional regulator [Flavobacterium sp. LS1R10]
MILKRLKFKAMTQNERLEKFAKLVSNEPSNFLAKLDHYKTNKKRLDQSAKVAVNVLEALKDKGWSQKDLAEKMNVSAQHVNKIVKGQENMTFETVDKLETALGIVLMEIIDYKPVNEIEIKAENIKAIQESWSEDLASTGNSYSKPLSNFKKKEGSNMKVVYNILNQTTFQPLEKAM